MSDNYSVAGDSFWRSEEDFLRNPPKQHVVMQGLLYLFNFLGFLTPKTQLISANLLSLERLGLSKTI